jgi:hypothetical protein
MKGSVLGIFMAVLCATATASLKEAFDFCDPDSACEGACYALHTGLTKLRRPSLMKGTCSNQPGSDIKMCHCQYGGVTQPDIHVERPSRARLVRSPIYNYEYAEGHSSHGSGGGHGNRAKTGTGSSSGDANNQARSSSTFTAGLPTTNIAAVLDLSNRGSLPFIASTDINFCDFSQRDDICTFACRRSHMLKTMFGKGVTGRCVEYMAPASVWDSQPPEHYGCTCSYNE